MNRITHVEACAEQVNNTWKEISRQYDALLSSDHENGIGSISGHLSRLLTNLEQNKAQVEMEAIWDSVETATPMERDDTSSFAEQVRNEFHQLTGEIEELIHRLKHNDAGRESEERKRCIADLERFHQEVDTLHNVLFQTPRIAFLSEVQNIEVDNRGGRIAAEREEY